MSTKYKVLSPDNITIDFNVGAYDSFEEAKQAFDEWAKGYERQGYYSSGQYGRIKLEELINYCTFEEVEEKVWTEQMFTFYNVATIENKYPPMEYDLLFSLVIQDYKKFADSPFYLQDKPEYECIEEYLRSLKLR